MATETVNEYEKSCPYCQKKFIANHLNRNYCSEQCKRRMFRKKKQEQRTNESIYMKNNNLIKQLSDKGISKVQKSILVKSGFDEMFYLKKFTYHDILLTLLEDFYLEALSENEFIIHKY